MLWIQQAPLLYLEGGHEAADREPLAPKGINDLFAKVGVKVDHVVDERQARCHALTEGLQEEDEELAKEVERRRNLRRLHVRQVFLPNTRGGRAETRRCSSGARVSRVGWLRAVAVG